MTYLEQLCALAVEKGIDPQEVISQFAQASNVTGYHSEELARIAWNLFFDCKATDMVTRLEERKSHETPTHRSQ